MPFGFSIPLTNPYDNSAGVVIFQVNGQLWNANGVNAQLILHFSYLNQGGLDISARPPAGDNL